MSNTILRKFKISFQNIMGTFETNAIHTVVSPLPWL